MKTIEKRQILKQMDNQTLTRKYNSLKELIEVGLSDNLELYFITIDEMKTRKLLGDD